MHMLGVLYVTVEHISAGIARFKDIAKHAAYRDGKGAGRFPVKKRDNVTETMPVYRVRIGQVRPLRQADVQQVQPESIGAGEFINPEQRCAMLSFIFCPITSGFIFVGSAGSIGGMPVILRKPKMYVVKFVGA